MFEHSISATHREELKSYALMLFETLRDDIRIVAEGVVALDGKTSSIQATVVALDAKVASVDAKIQPRHDPS